MRAFLTSLVVAFVVLSALADRGSRSVYRDVTGTVAQFEAGRWIEVATDANRQSVGTMLRVPVSDTTIYEREDGASALDPAAIMPGIKVRMWYRSVPGTRPRVSKVRVLPDATPR